jgi:hypothetical protein
MEMEMKDDLGLTMDRLAATADMLERVVEQLAQRHSAFAEDATANINRIVATVEAHREAELEEKLAAAELKIAQLQARGAADAPASGRKTLPSAMSNLLAKQGVTLDSLEAGSLDAALGSLSIEQRIAVKSQLIRAGILT